MPKTSKQTKTVKQTTTATTNQKNDTEFAKDMAVKQQNKNQQTQGQNK